MTDIKSQILSEVEERLGSGYVQTVHEAMEKCPTLRVLIDGKVKPCSDGLQWTKEDFALYGFADEQLAIAIKGNQVTDTMVDYFLSRLGVITKEEAANWKANGTTSDTRVSAKRALQEMVDKYGKKNKPWYKFW